MKRWMLRAVRRLGRDEDGASVVEYAVLVCLIGCATVSGLYTMANAGRAAIGQMALAVVDDGPGGSGGGGSGGGGGEDPPPPPPPPPPPQGLWGDWTWATWATPSNTANGEGITQHANETGFDQWHYVITNFASSPNNDPAFWYQGGTRIPGQNALWSNGTTVNGAATLVNGQWIPASSSAAGTVRGTWVYGAGPADTFGGNQSRYAAFTPAP